MMRDLLHPDLMSKGDFYLMFHSTFPFKYMYPESDRINWYGDIKLYATEPLYQAYLVAHPQEKGDIVIGPS